MYIKFGTFRKKKVSLLAEVFPKLLIPNEVVTLLSKTLYFRTPFGKKRVSGFETVLKAPRHHYYRISA